MRHCSVIATICVAAAAVASARPNIVLILADDLDFDYKQDRLAIMPNLKRLREEGLHLVNHVAAQPVCGPSRSSLLAGRYPCVGGWQPSPISIKNSHPPTPPCCCPPTPTHTRCSA